jgi:hypothetical protein
MINKILGIFNIHGVKAELLIEDPVYYQDNYDWIMTTGRLNFSDEDFTHIVSSTTKIYLMKHLNRIIRRRRRDLLGIEDKRR